MDRESIKRISHLLRTYSRVCSLTKKSKTELVDMPKEVIIAYAANEIALVWEKLPEQLQNDIDILKYKDCNDDNFDSKSGDIYDRLPPRKLFCCYCKVRDVKLSNSVIIDKEVKEPQSSISKKVMSKNLCCQQL